MKGGIDARDSKKGVSRSALSRESNSFANVWRARHAAEVGIGTHGTHARHTRHTLYTQHTRHTLSAKHAAHTGCEEVAGLALALKVGLLVGEDEIEILRAVNRSPVQGVKIGRRAEAHT